ncbi:uncharacterized protein LOC122382800 isoform X2 [Amphibalanus amphitrite]|uniref:uncharacterized protein LOC122382800 isoform X2 n=1 Tax=Amphibalanus amphitrite TaxID=1232801 RepID=UPI001C8FD6DB|nr:uncharacterized protein LOC122382800 isoform X2 [Amphibalanus amphitrite]
MPVPQNVKELLTFLGLMTYNAKFMPNLSSVLRPLYDLTKKGAKWVWTQECQNSFSQAKAGLSGAGALAHYDVDRPLKMYCDASSSGVGACLVHQFPDGVERPVAYASRTLSEAEQKYAQIEREGLGIIFGVKRFHQYICGRHFTLVTDHRPLCRIFSPSAETSSVAAARLQRWALILSMYDYEIEFVSGLQNVPADVLSRLPSRTESDDETWQVCSAEEEELICATIEDDILPVTADQVARQTARDPVLGPVLSWVRSGAWPKKTEAKFQPYIRCRDGLTVVDGCLQVIPCCCETCDPARRLSGAELLLLDGSDLWCTRSASTAGPGPLTWTTCWRTGPCRTARCRPLFRDPSRTARCRPLFRDPSRPEPTIDRGSIWRTTGARLPVVHRCRCRVRSRRPGRLIGVGRVGTPTGSGPSALQRTLDCGVRVRLVCDRGMSVRVNQC